MAGKGIALVSGIIFLAITITAVIIIYQTGIPFVKKLQSSVVVDQMKTALSQLDKVIKTVGSEGQGSQRTVTLSIDSGELKVDKDEDSVSWRLETDAFIVSPRTMQQIDNLKTGSNLETSAYETYIGDYVYAIENEHLIVYIKKIGAEDNLIPYSTKELVVRIHNKNIDRDLLLESIEILFNDGGEEGSGFTMLEQTGNNLPYGTVKAFMNPSDSDINYEIEFTLESGADFLTIRGGL